MSTVDLAIQRVSGLDERLAAKLLAWLDSQQAVKSAVPHERPLGARAMIGFAAQGGHTPRSKAEWMKELR